MTDRVGAQVTFQNFERRGFILGGPFLLQTLHRFSENGYRPPGIKNLLGRQIFERLESISIFSIFSVQKNKFLGAASLEGTRPITFRCQKILERSKQERSKPSLHRMNLMKSSVFQEMQKKTLRNILSIVGGISAPPCKCV